jgi:hypothetical protein
LGKGFTLAEVKAVGLGVEFAKSVGIAVDHRRKNRSQEGFEANKARLSNYLSKLVLYPRHESHLVTKAKTGIINDTPKVYSSLFRINKLLPPHPLSTLFLPLSKELDQSASSSLRDLESQMPTEALDRNGTIKETRVRGKRRLRKLLKRTTDCHSYLIHLFISFCQMNLDRSRPISSINIYQFIFYLLLISHDII